MFRILAINPGSTSTKIGVYEDENPIFVETVAHSYEDLKDFKTINDQKDYRLNIIKQILKNHNIDKLDAIVARGGLIKPLKAGGTYEINDAMLHDLQIAIGGAHSSNLGGLIARSIADEMNIKAYTVDPTVVDELEDKARYSGCKELPRLSKYHVLNQKAIARKYAQDRGLKYENVNVVVCHMGGGVSVGAHRKGKCIDVNNTLDGEGPFTPERAGTLPTGDLIKLCYSGKYSFEEMYSKAVGNGGMVGYVGSNNFKEITERAKQGDEDCKKVIEAFTYDVSKFIGAMAIALENKIDAIILTGGIAYAPEAVEPITNYVKHLAPVVVYPGENELLSLTQGTLRVLRKDEEVKQY